MFPLDLHERSLLNCRRIRGLQSAVVGASAVLLHGVDVQRHCIVVVIVGEGRGVAGVAVRAVRRRRAHVPCLDAAQLRHQLRLVRLTFLAQLQLAALLQFLLLLLEPCQVAVGRESVKSNRTLAKLTVHARSR